MSNIAAIILAAGASERMGEPKQLLPFQGRSLLRHAALTALASRCRSVFIVLGAQAERLAEEVNDLAVQIVENPAWADGMGTSIRAGIAALSVENTDGALLMLCDQPLITAATLDELVTLYEQAQPSAVASAYAGALGVPALFSRALFPELLALPGQAGAKQVLLRHQAHVKAVAVAAGQLDVDTPADYARLRQADRR